MMAKEKLQIVLDADWKGRSEIQNANRDIEQLDDGVASAKAGFAILAVAAVAALAAIGAAAKVAWDELGKGAALIQSREQFDNLAKSIHTTADAMLGKLKEATNGMVSDAKLIAGAGQIISLGLADTEDGVVRLATLVAKLGWDMQQVIMTFANNSVMRLDSLGLSVEDVNNKMKDLVDIGISADKAFDMAVIEAGEEKLLLLGDTADTTAGDIKVLQTAWEEARDAFSIGFTEGAIEEVGILAENVDLATESVERMGGVFGGAAGWFAIQQFGVTIAFEALDLALARGAISQEEYNNKVHEFSSEGLSAQEVLTYLKDKTADWKDEIDRSVKGLGDQIAAAASADIILRRYAIGVGVATEAVAGLNAAMSLMRFGTITHDTSLKAYDRAGATPMYTTRTPQALIDFATPFMDRDLKEYDRGIKQIAEDAEQAAKDAENLAGGIGSVGIAAESAADKMARLAAETGKFFDQARRSEDFDPAEAFYSAALAAGASAEQLQQLLVATGLETPERAQEIYNESIQRQLAQQAGQAYKEGGNLDMIWQGIQSGMANPAWAQQVTQQISQDTDVGGVNVEINIYGNITGEDLDMVVDNAIAESVEQYGG